MADRINPATNQNSVIQKNCVDGHTDTTALKIALWFCGFGVILTTGSLLLETHFVLGTAILGICGCAWILALIVYAIFSSKKRVSEPEPSNPPQAVQNVNADQTVPQAKDKEVLLSSLTNDKSVSGELTPSENEPFPITEEVQTQLSISSDDLCSAEKMLSEANAFLQTNLEDNILFTREKFSRAVVHLRQNKDSRWSRFLFFLRYHFYPKLMVMGDAIEVILEAYCYEKSHAIKTFLSCSDLTTEDLDAPLFSYGDGANWGLLEEITTGLPIDVLELALKKGCNPNKQSESTFGNTPLVWGIANDAKQSAVALVEICERLQIGIDLNLPSIFNGNTPLILCIAKGHARPGHMSNFELTKFLLSHGANPNIPDDLGNTPLHYACLRREPATVELLMEHGACITTKNLQQKTPSDLLCLTFEESKELLFYVTNGSDQGSCSFYERDFLHDANKIQLLLTAS